MINNEDMVFLNKKYPMFKVLNSPSIAAGPALCWSLFIQDQLLGEIRGLREDLKEINKQWTKDIK